MDHETLAVTIIPFVDAVHRPVPASRKVREAVPPGYGRREHCRPFVDANGAGLGVPSPFAWGFCRPEQAPGGARVFRSPVAGGCPARAFYVCDDAALHFRGNQFAISPKVTARTGPIAMPGLSFFERPDQQRQVKLHLPYMMGTKEGTALLFTPPLNRAREDGLTLLSGLVETAWYADAVNMVFALPDGERAVHVAAGEIIAQAIPVPSHATRSVPCFPESHRRQVRDAYDAFAQWKANKNTDRAAYKKLARAVGAR